MSWEDAGFETDWTDYPFEIRKLVRHWRDAEREITLIQQQRLQAVLKSYFKEQ